MYDLYEIQCINNGRCYYGRSQELEKRWRAHVNMLRRGTHNNKGLQEEWATYGENAFSFVKIATFTDMQRSIDAEQLLIDYNADGYNISDAKSGGDTFTNNPRKEEISALKSQIFSGKGNPMYGRPKTEYTIKRIKEANSKAVIIEEDSEDITAEMSDLLCDCCQKPLDADSYEGFCSKTCPHEYNGLSEEADAVNSPTHYTQGKFETIEIIEEITKGYSDGYVAYCVGNTLKYLARAPHKHAEPTEDLRKASKYLEFAIGRLTQDER